MSKTENEKLNYILPDRFNIKYYSIALNSYFNFIKNQNYNCLPFI